MTEFELLNIETYVLKVHLNCQGCRNKVKKLLTKVKGVYQVKIDAEGESVMVSGTAQPETLIKKLHKSGKHAQLWSPKDIQEPLMPAKDNKTPSLGFGEGEFDENMIVPMGGGGHMFPDLYPQAYSMYGYDGDHSNIRMVMNNRYYINPLVYDDIYIHQPYATSMPQCSFPVPVPAPYSYY